jgi:hypothetical protein
VLYNLDWLTEGNSFPPESERERLDMYNKNRLLFEDKHFKVYEETLKRIERVVGNWQNVISYPIILNYQKVMSLKIADLLLGEAPIISSVDATEKTSLENIISNTDLINTAFQAAIDVSRYGDGILKVFVKDGRGEIDVVQPAIWFPIVNQHNIHETLYHVLAWLYDKGTKLMVQIYTKGFVEERVYEMTNSEHASLLGRVIGKLVSSTGLVNTGLNDFSLIQIPNVLTSDRATGIDDYTSIDSIISDLMVRLGQIDRILDKHANPTMQGPDSAVEQDPASGEYRVKVGGYISREQGDVEAAYLVWNGQLEMAFKQIDKLQNLLYSQSEMGSAIFGDMLTMTGQVPSGSALQRLMLSPLKKVNRIRMRFDPAMKKALKLCSQLGGEGISLVVNPTINWQDGLPADAKEMAEVMMVRTANKATISQQSAIKLLDNQDDAGAVEEINKIDVDTGKIKPAQPKETNIGGLMGNQNGGGINGNT